MVMRWFLSLLTVCTASLPVWSQGYFSTIGYNELQNRLGAANTPNGAGVPVAQIEANGGGVYAPDPIIAAGRPGFTITFNGSATVPAGFSGHATSVGGIFFGNSSMATGITKVDAWDANVWIDTVLNTNMTGVPPSTYLPKVSNHSYIGTLSAPGTPNGYFQADAEADLKRSDYLVDRTGHIMIVGVGNNAVGEPAPLFGQGYNSIAVGRSDGIHGQGFTTLAVAGRVKPDLVAPMSSVSAATPVVAAAAALLVQTAGATPFASDPRTIKAVLMTGATKANLNTWTHTPTVPLDTRFGAGEVNINLSHMILTAGRQTPGTTATVSSTGWDFNSINSNAPATTSRSYFFDVAAGQSVRSFSATLTWHREFAAGDATNFNFADLNLKLYNADASFLLLGSPIDQSISAVDNVEHLWRTTAMPAGRYAIVVEANGLAVSDYAVAWQFIPVPEPGAIGFSVVVIAFVIRRFQA
jgi:hypothetical protein